MMTVELPYEVWLHILRFLSPETIRQLRLVSTLMYNLSLDEHHRTTQIGCINARVTHPPLRDLGNSKRVRVLLIGKGPIYLRSHEDESPRPSVSKPSFWKLTRKFSRTRHIEVRHESKLRTGLDGLLDAVLGLTRLITLAVELPHSSKDPSHAMKIKVLEAGWPIFSTTLTTLSLDVPLEEIHLVIPSHNTLLRLESFSIVFSNFHTTSEPNEFMRRTVSPFLINHRSTLRSLKLTTRENMAMSSILADLPHMPYLRNLDISHPFVNLMLTSFVGLYLFLESHCSQLDHLNVDFVCQAWSSPSDITDEFFNQEWCRVLLPALQSLSIRLSDFVVCHCDAAVVPFLQRQIPFLKSLKVHGFSFSYNQMASIISGPQAGGYQLMTLRMLDMVIQCFSPDLLSLLANRTPQLWSLKLAVDDIAPDRQFYFPEMRIPEFCKALQSRYFPDWGLHDLDVTYCWGVPMLPSEWNQCKVALFQALPNLKQFGGLGPTECWPEEYQPLWGMPSDYQNGPCYFF